MKALRIVGWLLVLYFGVILTSAGFDDLALDLPPLAWLSALLVLLLGVTIITVAATAIVQTLRRGRW